MAQDYAKQFYNSPAWKHTRNGYLKHVGGLCEICLAKGLYTPAEIVHHKIPLTPQNITNLSVSLSWDNLQALCRLCHAAEHEETYAERNRKYMFSGRRSHKRWGFDKKTGELVVNNPPPL